MNKFVATSFDSGYTPVYLANGIIGLQLGKVPFQNGRVCVNGFIGRSETTVLSYPYTGSVDAYAPAPFPLAADVEIEEIILSRCPDFVHIEKQILDISCGELITLLRFDTPRGKAEIKVLNFTSRSVPPLICQEIELRIDRPCKIRLVAFIDSSGLPGHYLTGGILPSNEVADMMLWWEAPGSLSSVGVAMYSDLCGEESFSTHCSDWGWVGREVKEYSFKLKHGEKMTLRQVGALVPSVMHSEPHLEAIRLVRYSKHLGFEKIRENNRKRWAELWKSRVKVIGADDQTQDVLDSAFFYVHSSIHPSSPCSASPFGLVTGVPYAGHVFWDAETFMFPAVLLSAPESARAMLDYRSRLVPAARYNAALMGFRGIMFPWEGSNSGDEVAPIWADTGVLEHHITPDVALAFAQYVHVTGDEIFLREKAWPILREVARWIVSRASLTERGYEMLNLMGPDEGEININNSAYFNAACILTLREAQWAARYLGYKPPSQWEEVAGKIVLNIDSNNVLIKHDGYQYQEGKMLNPDTLMVIFPMNFPLRKEVERATLRWYLKRVGTYAGGPMFPPLLCVHAARLGDRALTTKLWEEGWKYYWKEPFGQFKEFKGMKNAEGTVYLAVPGGLLNAVMIGLSGLIIGPDEPRDWCKKRIVLPDGWQEIEISQIWVRGKKVSLRAKHGAAHAEIQFE
ncbi:MAG: glycoside hydrolase family 65 protein [Thermoproteales archaeon]|nr:glycoside hydrolase family 65 protein [Thermoproteales archaeon]